MSLKQELVRRVAFVDVEIAEDLNRRVPQYNTLKELSNFFRMLLAQYNVDTMLYRSTIREKEDIELWFTDFFRFVLPFIRQHGMPDYTDTKSIPMYQSTASLG